MAGELVLLSRLAEIARARGSALKMDVLNFRGTVPTSGNVTQPSTVKIRNNFEYYAIELRAGLTAASDLDDLDEIRFQLSESGTGENMFSTDLEISPLIAASSGQSVPMRFEPYGYKLGSGSDITCEITRRASTITTERDVVIQLVCVIVPVEFKNVRIESAADQFSRVVKELMGEFFDRLRRAR